MRRNYRRIRRLTAIAIVVGIPATSGALLAAMAAHVVREEGVLPGRPIVATARPAAAPTAAAMAAPMRVASSLSKADAP